MNSKTIEYPNNNEDIFTKLKRLVSKLELFAKQKSKFLNYLLGGITMLALALIIWITKC